VADLYTLCKCDKYGKFDIRRSLIPVDHNVIRYLL